MSPGNALLVLTLCTVPDEVLNLLTFAGSSPLSSVAQSVDAQTVLPTANRPAEVGLLALASDQCRSSMPFDSRYPVTVRPTSTNNSVLFAATANTCPLACRTTTGAEVPWTTKTVLPLE